MMKKFVLIWILLLMWIIPSYADSKSCKKAFDDALSYFHSGQYYDAQLLFIAISDECGKNYKNVDAMLQLCNHKLKEIDVILYIDNNDADMARNIKSTEGNITFEVTCYGDYDVVEIPYWCELVDKSRNSFEIAYGTNNEDSIRSGNIVVNGGGQTINIQLTQEPLPTLEEDSVEVDSVLIEVIDTVPVMDTTVVELSSEPEVEEEELAPLTVSHTAISATEAGTTEYIDVICGKEWEVQYPSGTMYSATKMNNRVKVKIFANSTYSSRNDYFYIRTKDTAESFKITLSQSAAQMPATSAVPAATSSSYVSTSSSTRYMSAYDKYCAEQGMFEVTWFGTNFSIGTGFEYAISALRLRWGFVQLNPIDLTIGVDFLELMNTSFMYSYQPSLNFVIPASENEAVYIGAGPVIGNYIWFKAEAGYRFHWGKNASSDVFVRYDGAITVGVSIQCSSHN